MFVSFHVFAEVCEEPSQAHVIVSAPMNRQNAVQILKWVVSIAILWLLFVSFDFPVLAKSVANAKPGLVMLAIAIGFFNICLSVVRWSASLSVQGIRAPFQVLLSSTLVSGFLGFLLPAFGEDAVRGYDLYKFDTRANKRGVNIAASILFERLCGLLGHVITGGIALALLHHRIANRTIVRAALVLYACIVVALLIVFSHSLSRWFVALLRSFPPLKAVAEKVESLTEAIYLYKHDVGAWTRVLGLSFVFQFSGFLYFFVIAKALSIDVAFSTFVLLVPIVTILSLVPISIGGLGVKEGLFVVLFAQLGVSQESAFLTSVVGSALYLLFVLLGGLVFLVRKRPQQEAIT